jgi:hypothetical protein
MNFPDVLPRITAALERVGIAYMITGSFASAYHGSLRSTQDIDLVIEATPVQLRALVESLPIGEYYVEIDAALDALKRTSMFNIIDQKSGWKIDMIVRKNRAFSREEFGRRQLITTQGLSFFVATAEDVVLAKLEWSKLSESQRQIADATSILKIRGDSLDRSYLGKWISELDLKTEWENAQRGAETSRSD